MIESGVYPKKKIDIIKILSEILTSDPDNVGAVLTFFGITKRFSGTKKEVTNIEVESYVEHASPIILKICQEVKEKYNLSFVYIYHFIGNFNVGDPLVFVAVGGKTRKKVFPAIQEAVERYKSEPALFKKEVYVDGSQQWISHA